MNLRQVPLRLGWRAGVPVESELTENGLIRTRDTVVVRSYGGSARRHSEIEDGQGAKHFGAWMAPGDEVFESEQSALEAEFEQRSVAPEGSVRIRQGRIQFVLSPG